MYVITTGVEIERGEGFARQTEEEKIDPVRQVKTNFYALCHFKKARIVRLHEDNSRILYIVAGAGACLHVIM